MTAHPSATTLATDDPEDRDPKHIPLAHREEQIAEILALALGCDREHQSLVAQIKSFIGGGVDAYKETVVVAHSAVRIDDTISTEFPFVHAELASALIGPISKLVDQALEFDAEWDFNAWPYDKQLRYVERLFAEAGVGDRFVLDKAVAETSEA